MIRKNYFNVSSLAFSRGVQFAARANLGGAMEVAMAAFGVTGNAMTLRAAVMMPDPLDLSGDLGTGAESAIAIKNGAILSKAAEEAAKPEAFVEFQFAPNTSLTMRLMSVNLTDATFFLDNSLVFGFKGNAAFRGAESKKIIMNFQTPLTPEGAMDFSFRMATPASYTMQDAAMMMVGMATPDPRLAPYGGGFIKNINVFKGPLLTMTKPLSVIQLRNPNPPPEYRFGDSNKPFPSDDKYFNFIIFGPLYEDGPRLSAAGNVTIMEQKMGWLSAAAGRSGLSGDAGEAISIKLGPLGNVKFSMQAAMAINADKQVITLLGNYGGQKVAVGMDGNTMTVEVNATCVNPFEIKTQVTIQASTNIADVFDGQGGVNVDPGKIGGCIGKELEAAYNKIAGEYKNLSGYTANEANEALNKIAGDAAAEYKKAKREARKAAESSIKSVTQTFSSGTNFATSTVTGSLGGGASKTIDISNVLFDQSVFDWDFYYDDNPNLVKKNVDLVKQWQDYGFVHMRRGSLEFDLQFYVNKYSDKFDPIESQQLTDAAPMTYNWLSEGIPKGRQGSADFDIQSYLARYPDLQKQLGATNYAGAFAHWMKHGKAAGRDGSPDRAKRRNAESNNASNVEEKK